MDPVDTLAWAGSAVAIIGAVLNAMKLRAGFVFYIASNVALISVGAMKEEFYNVILFTVFLAISLYGFFNWRRIDQAATAGGQHGKR